MPDAETAEPRLDEFKTVRNQNAWNIGRPLTDSDAEFLAGLDEAVLIEQGQAVFLAAEHGAAQRADQRRHNQNG